MMLPELLTCCVWVAVSKEKNTLAVTVYLWTFQLIIFWLKHENDVSILSLQLGCQTVKVGNAINVYVEGISVGAGFWCIRTISVLLSVNWQTAKQWGSWIANIELTSSLRYVMRQRASRQPSSTATLLACERILRPVHYSVLLCVSMCMHTQT